MEVVLKNEGGLNANNSVSIAAKMTNDKKIQAYIEKLEEENHDLQQKWLEEGFEKSKLVTENKRLNLIIQGNEEEIENHIANYEMLKLHDEEEIECLKDELKKAKEIIRNLIRPLTEEEKHLTIDVRYFFKKRAEEFLKE